MLSIVFVSATTASLASSGRLPDGLEWRSVTAPALRSLLSSSYVASADGSLAVDYPESTLRWMLDWPGARAELRLGLAVCGSDALVGCICAAPSELLLRGQKLEALEVGLLCVHRSWRSRGLTPLMLRELRVRAAELGLSSAVYTLAASRGTPLLCARCFHRPLRLGALRRRGFWVTDDDAEGGGGDDRGGSRRRARQRLAPLPRGGRLRRMRAADVPRCLELLRACSRRHAFAPAWSEAEFRHRFLGRAARSFVLSGERRGAPVRAFVSFMLLPLRTRSRPLLQAQLLGLAADEEAAATDGSDARPRALLAAALRAARREGAHVFNALAMAEHSPLLLGALGFQEGDGATNIHLLAPGKDAGRLAASDVAWLPVL